MLVKQAPNSARPVGLELATSLLTTMLDMPCSKVSFVTNDFEYALQMKNVIKSYQDLMQYYKTSRIDDFISETAFETSIMTCN